MTGTNASAPEKEVYPPTFWRNLPHRGRGRPRKGPLGKANDAKVALMDYINKHPHLSGNQKRVGCHLVWLYRETKGYSWPSIPAIMEELGLHRATICRAVEKLHKLGLIYRESGGGFRNGSFGGKSNEYYPALSGNEPGYGHSLQECKLFS